MELIVILGIIVVVVIIAVVMCCALSNYNKNKVKKMKEISELDSENWLIRENCISNFDEETRYERK